ncbi:MAG: carbamoyltransferase HypF [Acidobacteriota bacterium]|nr:carbamoyltransferase HypF [Acidobacteriota bacterium]
MRAGRRRVRLEVRGAVQGVGFRPYVFRLAGELGLGGWVGNDHRGVVLEAEGEAAAVSVFLERFPAELPPRAVVHEIERSWVEVAGATAFVIRESGRDGARSAVLLPDAATCEDCVREILDPRDRRYGYPFTNCTNCGPRFSIITGLPYDRPRTTMAGFAMCAACAAEYADPRDRRFHAQPNACPACGPRLWLEDGAGAPTGGTAESLAAAAGALREGRILAVKGLGGFHLMVDARDEESVARLRRRKGRYEKPLALMVPDLETARRLCAVDAVAAAALTSAEAPIVLLPRRPDAGVAAAVAPGNPRLGVMLPYTPLHHLLLRAVGFPLVATSGNLSDEPICTDNAEARERLKAIADLFLLHDRPIARHVDDSVLACPGGAFLPIRRARGLAPLPILVPRPSSGEAAPGILAVGAHQKNVVALMLGRRVFLSQHIGDMETPQAYAAFERVIRDFLSMYEARPALIAHDLHPDYLSTRWAREVVAGGVEDSSEAKSLLDGELVPVQHHHAHLASCLAEHGSEGRALGVIWDGTGLGTDGTIWGGEFLLGDARGFERVAALRPFRLPGGEAAVREPRRVALALLWELFGEEARARMPAGAFDDEVGALLGKMLATGSRAPVTTSAGRLFDGVAALVGLRNEVSFEGQAAMELEFVADWAIEDAYSIDVREGAALELDWRPLLAAVVEDSRRGVPAAIIAARFHGALAEGIGRVAERVGEPVVALSGGCFQNLLLTERCRRRLRRGGFEVLIHRQVPPNDGGISLGQAAVAAARRREPT